MSHLLLPQPQAALPGVGVTGHQHWCDAESFCTEYHTDQGPTLQTCQRAKGGMLWIGLRMVIRGL